MKYLIIALNLLIFTINLDAQTMSDHDEKSKAVLEKVSENYQKNKSIKFNFKLTILSEDLNETQNGMAILYGDKFYYNTNEREVISDGESVWTYLIEDNECYIDLVEDLENSINPKEIFTIWKTGFKFQYIDKKIKTNQTFHKIKMFPENPNESKYHTLVMEINETTANIDNATIKSKDGVTIKFYIKDLKANPTLDINKFLWDSSKYPNVDEIDNR